MDRSLDEIISERPVSSSIGSSCSTLANAGYSRSRAAAVANGAAETQAMLPAMA
jgi:hypothetical protein